MGGHEDFVCEGLEVLEILLVELEIGEHFLSLDRSFGFPDGNDNIEFHFPHDVLVSFVFLRLSLEGSAFPFLREEVVLVESSIVLHDALGGT